METEINIVEILKDKPQGTKLYSSACGKCKLEEVDDKSFKISFYNSKFGFMNGGEGHLDKNGKLYDDGECVVFPSKEMRDWSKFAWKKGDVLVCTDGKCKVIFERFDDDTYTSFVGKYYVECYGKNDELQDYEEEHYGDTVNYTKESEEAAQTYINTIEERLGGKLNMETLEIDKTQPEFKDRDVVCISGMGYLAYGIVKSINNSSKKLEYYVLNDMSTLKFEDWLSFEDKQIQPITETQQIILFDALEKEGKRWDAEKKQIVDLKPKIELKPFDKVLSRRCSEDYWVLNFYSHKSHKTDYHICIDGSSNLYCIPYNEETAHLLGTTDEWKGGEG
jgi:hypothetical protein